MAILGIVVLLLTACGGTDLSKRTFERSTVPIEPAQGRGKVPEGPIEDSTVSAESLRTIAPCGVLGNGALKRLGKPDDISARSWSECVGTVTAPGDNKIEVRLEIGADIRSFDDPSGQVAGLPLIVATRDNGDCVVTATTSKDAGIGIAATVGYDDGQACRVGKVVIDETIQELHNDPPTLPDAAGSLTRIDPCSVLDGGEVSEVLDGKPEQTPSGVYGCYWVADQPRVSVSFRKGPEPTNSDDRDEVDLGEGVTGYSRQTVDSIDTCRVEWAHRGLDKHTAELVTVKYENYGGDPESDKPCDKAETVAKSVVNELPRTG